MPVSCLLSSFACVSGFSASSGAEGGLAGPIRRALGLPAERCDATGTAQPPRAGRTRRDLSGQRSGPAGVAVGRGGTETALTCDLESAAGRGQRPG